MNEAEKFQSITMALLPIYAAKRLGHLAIHGMKVDQMVDTVYGELVTSIHGYVLGVERDNLVYTLEVDVPASWWQHTKLVHFPTISRWLRRPPTTRTIAHEVEVDVWDTYPEAHIEVPEKLFGRRVVQVATTGASE